MNKINTDIISTTGININKYDILPSKVFINGVEITDTESWNKAINKIDEKDKEIDRLNNIIKNLDKMFEYYFLGNLKYDQDTVNTIYIKYIKLKELKEGEKK